MSLAHDIKCIIMDFIKKKYFDYLINNNLLIIENSNLNKIISEFYNSNSKELKNKIRTELKDKMKTQYPSVSVENTLYDIFQDTSLNINRIVLEIENYQNSIIKSIDLKINKKNLGIKINIGNHVEIVNAKNPNDDEQNKIYDIINNYNYIYSINDTLLSLLDNNTKISTIKNFINNFSEISMVLIK